MNTKNNPHHIVIVGGGAGGAELAKKLGDSVGKNKQAIVTLVDAKLTHIWKPLLHEIAAGTLNSSIEAMEYIDHAHRHHYNFQLGYVDHVDPQAKEISIAPTLDDDEEETIPRRSLKYDTLILSVGSLTKHFNTKGVVEYCKFLDTLEEANNFQSYLMRKMLRAQNRTQELRPGQLHVAIVGAGATGIELAAELHGATKKLIAFGFDKLEASRDIKITIIEASPSILPALPKRLSDAALEELRKLNIEVMTDERVVEAKKEGLITHTGKFIPAETMVWAAGIKAPNFLTTIDGLETNAINQLLVKTTLQTTNDENIFAFGDCASCPLIGEEGFVPPRAQAAHQQASLLVKTMKYRLAGKDNLPEYRYVDYGSLVNLGHYSTVGNLMGNLMGRWSGSMSVEGFVARMVYKSLYRMHLIALHGYTREILMTIANWITNRGLKPRLKLH
ncbi:NAD(P)/FAD-dependent oxidoreductase [Cocleimonas sp. KMM 6892]|uniref:NAD(P)/FAD-dependent oxidoreductase n=1 Tax=unclassified Cocleimonas TaxID=2639732 RepID=UPI002DBEF41A|nr:MULTISPECIES: NAD(P)/FAD-dependent oxidoreductase [unclassified Cocleimonas]MEB8432766.1 NAD(P)/FAD-dependent oxidoreductase [Cocleimonas sp. KMM 6892]MEC4715625.1 NAD(P)/FAD-dependent oxidoreductase [Cocleimonas sp. KMM 6895]MEC4744757.1 NAD(P)/FAD-dependent oxidoreductase [Cocleimonas sp. KMM 6896]